jgi:hypothetical protein
MYFSYFHLQELKSYGILTLKSDLIINDLILIILECVIVAYTLELSQVVRQISVNYQS